MAKLQRDVQARKAALTDQTRTGGAAADTIETPFGDPPAPPRPIEEPTPAVERPDTSSDPEDALDFDLDLDRSPLSPPPLTADDVRSLVADELSRRDPSKASGASLLGPRPALSITSEELVELRTVLNGMHIESPRDLINAVRRMTFVRIDQHSDDGTHIAVCTLVFPEDVCSRIYSRLPIDTTAEEYLQEKIGDWLDMHVNGGL